MDIPQYDGYAIVILNNGQKVVVEVSQNRFYSANIDKIDDDEVSMPISIMMKDVSLIEQITKQRYDYLVEMAYRNRVIQDINSLLQFKQLTEQAQQLNIGHDQGPIEPQTVGGSPGKIIDLK